MTFQPGPGFFTLAVTGGADGYALAVLERRVEEQAVRSAIESRPRFAWTEQITDRDRFVDHFRLALAESFPVEHPRGALTTCVVKLATDPARDGETTIVLDMTELGDGWERAFHGEDIGRDNYTTNIRLSREPRPALGLTSLRDVQSTTLAILDAKRIAFEPNDPRRAEIERLKEHVSPGHEPARLTLAIALACWYASRRTTDSPWPGRKRPPEGSAAAHRLEQYAGELRAHQRIRDEQREALRARGRRR